LKAVRKFTAMFLSMCLINLPLKAQALGDFKHFQEASLWQTEGRFVGLISYCDKLSPSTANKVAKRNQEKIFAVSHIVDGNNKPSLDKRLQRALLSSYKKGLRLGKKEAGPLSRTSRYEGEVCDELMDGIVDEQLKIIAPEHHLRGLR